jgi:hypothetical protein
VDFRIELRERRGVQHGKAGMADGGAMKTQNSGCP